MDNLLKKGIIIITILVLLVISFNIYSNGIPYIDTRKNSVSISETPGALQYTGKDNNIPSVSSSKCTEQDIIKEITADKIKKVIIKADPPGQKAKLTQEEITEFIKLLNNIVLHEKTSCYTETSGQMVTFNITRIDGTKIELIGLNPFFVIDGQAYIAEYIPCEELNQFANRVLKTGF